MWEIAKWKSLLNTLIKLGHGIILVNLSEINMEVHTKLGLVLIRFNESLAVSIPIDVAKELNEKLNKLLSKLNKEMYVDTCHLIK